MRWPLPASLAALIVMVSTYAASSVPAAAPAAAAPAADEKGRWINISDTLIASLEAEGKKPGYPGKAAGIIVDPATGNVFMAIPDQGLFLSADHGTTWTRTDGKNISGRCETGGTLQFDPAGKRLACFMLDGIGGMTLDGGKTWSRFSGVGRNWDYASVDWSAENPVNILALRHESGGELHLSTNAGKSWKQVAKDNDYNGVGCFDAKTLIATKGKGGIFRSTDAGATWTKVADFAVTSHVPVVIKGTALFVSKEGLITSADQGATWTKHGVAVDATWGPIVADAKHMVVSGPKGISETKDGGDIWTLVLKFPASYMKYNGPWYNNVGWDAKNDIFYISHMGEPAFKWQR